MKTGTILRDALQQIMKQKIRELQIEKFKGIVPEKTSSKFSLTFNLFGPEGTITMEYKPCTE